VNRTDFQQLASVRVADARALLEAGRWDGAYYLAGYVVECALKACIAKGFQEGNIPDKGSVDKIYVHNLKTLLKLADLDTELNKAMAADPQLEVAWGNAVPWNESDRYEHSHTQEQAQDVLDAVTNPAYGVLQWIQRHW